MVQLRAFDDDGELIADDTILNLDKGSDRLEDLGLSLSESKDILAGLQRPMIEAQLAAYVDRYIVAASVVVVPCSSRARINFCSARYLALCA